MNLFFNILLSEYGKTIYIIILPMRAPRKGGRFRAPIRCISHYQCLEQSTNP